ncbi:MAG: tryptophan 7-halogenase [Lentisphaeria bacterium]|nr:tryptophan 7-halogenase [Lentisphaeria bacterium]
MKQSILEKIVIVGGGSAGWMTAAALSKFLPKDRYSISLVESDNIGTVGVGEATIPHIRLFNQILGIDEAEFIKETNATFKLGIELNNWANKGDSYFHPFGDFGEPINGISFHHYWLMMQKQGNVPPISDFSVPVVAAKNAKFCHPHSNKESLLSMYSYAYHLDATSYAKYLRKYSEERGVIRKEGVVTRVIQNPESGDVSHLTLQDSSQIKGDFFIDCSGFIGLLIEKTLKTGFEDWSHWFICDSAVAIQSESHGSPLPYTKATAVSAGWMWKIPLQNRIGNGYVYSRRFCDDSTAEQELLKQVRGKLLSEPKVLRFMPGIRKKSWNHNCVAIGLSAGFLEPLESTSLYLIQVGIMKLLEFLPLADAQNIMRVEYNNVIANEYHRIKDFLILHYYATNRKDSPFWRHVRTINIPKSLKDKILLFQNTGYVEDYREGLFLEPSWLAVYFGQGIYPRYNSPKAQKIDIEKLYMFLLERAEAIKSAVSAMPSHITTINNINQAHPKIRLASNMSMYGENYE